MHISKSQLQRIIQEELEDTGLNLKHPIVGRGYDFTDEEYAELDDIDKLNLLAAEEESSKTIPFRGPRRGDKAPKTTYGDTASPTYFKSPEFYEYEDSMRAVRGKPTKEQSQRNEELWRATEKFIELSDKEVGMPMHRSWEDWLSLRNQIRWSPEILLRHATRMSSVEQNEALSALQIEYPELFGPPGTPFRATDDFVDRALEILGLDREELKLDFREKDVFGRPLPPKEEPVHTLPMPHGSQLSENRLNQIIKEELQQISQETNSLGAGPGAITRTLGAPRDPAATSVRTLQHQKQGVETPGAMIRELPPEEQAAKKAADTDRATTWAKGPKGQAFGKVSDTLVKKANIEYPNRNNAARIGDMLTRAMAGSSQHKPWDPTTGVEGISDPRMQKQLKRWTTPKGMTRTVRKKAVAAPETATPQQRKTAGLPTARRATPVMQERLKQTIQEEFTKILNEDQRKNHLYVDITLQYEKDFTFYGYVLNQIRALPGVTIAKVSDEGAIDIYPDKKKLFLRLKFIPDRPLTQYLYGIKRELQRIQDLSGTRILSAQLSGIPTQID